MPKEYKAYESTFKARHDDGGFEWTLTKKMVDRAGEVVLPDGIRIPRGKTDIPILWLHGFDLTRGDLPIGQMPVKSIMFNEKTVVGKMFFDSDDMFAQSVVSKINKGMLDSGSIGFNPLKQDREAEIKGQRGRTIREWELLEFSIVPVPENAGALRKDMAFYKSCVDYMQSNFERREWPAKISGDFDLQITLAEMGNRVKQIIRHVEDGDTELQNKHIELITGYLSDLKVLIGRNGKAVVDKPNSKTDQDYFIPGAESQDPEPEKPEDELSVFADDLKVTQDMLMKLF